MVTTARISFNLFDVTAKQDSSPEAVDRQPFVNLLDLKEDGLSPPRYATCERDQFLLDGSLPLFPDTPAGMPWGLWSLSMSGVDGAFPEPPTLTINFTQSHSSLGITFHFGSGEYASALHIKWFNQAGFVIAERSFQPGGPVYFASHKVEGYYKLEITFLRTNLPFRYLKLTAIDYGVLKVFEGEEIVSANVLEECDVTSAELSINTLDFRLHSTDAEFSILNPGGAFSALQQEQALRVQELVDGEIIEMGTFYLDSWESETENISKFSAIDLVGVIDKDSFLGGVYVAVLAQQLVEEILGDTPFMLHPSLQTAPVSGYIPICTKREALQQVAFALCAVVDCSRSDTINIYPPPVRPSQLIPYSRKLMGQTMKLKPLVTGVEVLTHSYTPGAEEQELYNDVLPTGEHTITFGEPMHSLTATGATITASGANWAQLQVDEEGPVLLTGQRYAVANTLIRRRAGELPSNAGVNTLRVEGATLAAPTAAPAIANGILGYYERRYENEFPLLPAGEMLADIVIVESMGGEKLKGVIERMDFDLTGGYIAKVRIAGVRIDTRWQDYTGELYAGQNKGVI